MRTCFDFHGRRLCKKPLDVVVDKVRMRVFCFSREHVHEYMESVRTVLREADQMENYGAHLCAVARNMMELFHVIYASIHEKEAQELPYLAGTERALSLQRPSH